MKVGKEGILGTIAALEAWALRDHAAVRARELEAVAIWEWALAGMAGFALRRLPDWTGNPIDRLEIRVTPEAGLFAWELADRLLERDPSIAVRDDLAEHGTIHLDPCNLKTGEAEIVAAAIGEEVARACRAGDGCRMTWSERRRQDTAGLLAWPD
jgi:L-seryl-tRNA(Ser) seleniumtransferase